MLQWHFVFFERPLQFFDGPRVQPRSPALRLPDLGARLFQRLALEVVALEELALFLRELLDRRPHPDLQLLHLEPLIRREGLIRHLHPVQRVHAGGEQRREALDRVGDVPDIVIHRR